MVNAEIRLIIFFAAKDGEALYNQQNQDWELTVWIPSLDQEGPLQKEMATHSSILVWKVP